MDSGCSRHMTGNKKWFSSLTPLSHKEYVTFGDEKKGIQVKQTKQGTFVHQAKYTKDLMTKFNMAELKPVSTPMSSTASLGPDEDGDAVDQR
jgi:hypothetical protein